MRVTSKHAPNLTNGVLPYMKTETTGNRNIQSIQLEPRVTDHSNTRDALQRKKKLRVSKDKSLNVILNEEFVADMNTNQNNGNDDTVVSTEPNTSRTDSLEHNVSGERQEDAENRNSNNRNQSEFTYSDRQQGSETGRMTEEDVGRHIEQRVAQRFSQLEDSDLMTQEALGRHVGHRVARKFQEG